jgi:hypothetical protein
MNMTGAAPSDSGRECERAKAKKEREARREIKWEELLRMMAESRETCACGCTHSRPC